MFGTSGNANGGGIGPDTPAGTAGLAAEMEKARELREAKKHGGKPLEKMEEDPK